MLEGARHYKTMEVSFRKSAGMARVLSSTVIAADKQVNELHDIAREKGELPTNYTKVHFVGEPGVGKTSTRKHLVKEMFNEREPHTDGIETNNVEITNVDASWKAIQGSGGENEFVKSLAWYIASKKRNRENFQDDKSKSENIQQTQAVKRSPKESFKYLFGFMGYSLLIILLFSALHLAIMNILHWGYLPFHWAFVIFYCLLWKDITAISITYRVSTGLSLYIFVEIISESIFSGFPNWIICIGTGFVMLIMNFTMGYGSKTGCLLAIFLAISPEQNDEFVLVRDFSINLSYWFQIFLRKSLILLTYLMCLHIMQVITSNQFFFNFKNVFNCVFVMLISSGLSAFTVYQSYSFWFFFAINSNFGMEYGFLFGKLIYSRYGGSYFLRRIISFIIVIGYLYLVGWSFPIYGVSLRNWSIRILGLVSVSGVELMRFLFIKQTEIPVNEIRNSFKIIEERTEITKRIKSNICFESSPTTDSLDRSMPARLVLMDYAGHKLYHATHQLFMSDFSIYLLVFNLHEVFQRLGNDITELEEMEKLRFWLQSICSHAKGPNLSIFLVGTHRSLVNDENISKVNNWLLKKLKFEFGDYFIVNGINSWIYAVENSIDLSQDPDAMKLMQDVLVAAYRCASGETFPLKWRKFRENIENYRKEGKFIVKVSEMRKLAETSLKIESDEEFNRMIKYFDRNGELLWDENSEEQNNYIVTDPSFLVNVLKRFVFVGTDREMWIKERNLPRKINTQVKRKLEKDAALDAEIEALWEPLNTGSIAFQSHYLAGLRNLTRVSDKLEEEILEKTGIAFRSLIERNLFDIGDIDSVIKIMQVYDLIVCIGRRKRPGSSRAQTEDTFLLPFRLKPLEDTKLFWDDQPGDLNFYFQFQRQSPISTLFLRLIVQCAQRSNDELFRDEDSWQQVSIHSNIARFRKDEVHYKVEYKKLSNGTTSEHVIELSIRNSGSWSCMYDLTKMLYKSIKIIRDRDFKWLKFNMIFSGIDKKTKAIVKFQDKSFPDEKCFGETCQLPKDSNIKVLGKVSESLMISNTARLVKAMQPESIALYLYQDGIITDEQLEDINECRATRCEKNNKLLAIIRNHGYQGLVAFSQSLHASEQSHLASLLEKPI